MIRCTTSVLNAKGLMNATIDLTPEQSRVQEAILAYVKDSTAPYLTVGGYAGTGKTTVVAASRALMEDKRVAFCAFTGKAGSVLRGKLADLLQPGDYCGTVHGLIYKHVESEITLGKRKPRRQLYFTKHQRIPYDLIVLDEASMMNQQLFQDLLSFGIPIVAVGDHGQLPPVTGTFNLMESPQLRLETIHRQVADHPIIKVATMARRYGVIPVGDHGDGVRKVLGSSVLSGMDLSSWMVLCGRNTTRVRMNQAIRKQTDARPMVGDKVVCLRNNRAEGIYNGMIGHIAGLYEEEETQDPHAVVAEVRFEDFLWRGEIHRPQFGQEKTIATYDKSMGALFDFGSCITVHKAQGSEAENVVLIEERFGPPDPSMRARWLYTAVTRAKSQLLIIG